MENKIFKGMLILASGAIGFKIVGAVRYYKMQKDLFEEVQREATDEK